MSGTAQLRALEQELDASVAEVIRLARAAGTNPAKVREVLLAIQARFFARLRIVEEHLSPAERDEASDAIWTFRHRRLDGFVADELAAYIKLAAPPPSLASVFGKAHATMSTEPLDVDARAELHRCKTCGAPRPADGLYGNCLYCGRALFKPRQEIE
jgi:3-hydroxyisobutyrate dehydrogenase-like beta-hydroxyacid dehydrogenase